MSYGQEVVGHQCPMDRKWWGINVLWTGSGGASMSYGQEVVGHQCPMDRKGWDINVLWTGSGGASMSCGHILPFFTITTITLV